VADRFRDRLAALGFASYRDYRKSPLWADIRSRVFDLKGRTCLRCNERRATQIHHTRYDAETMAGRTLVGLVPICGPCHAAEHPEHHPHPKLPTKPVIRIPWDGKAKTGKRRKGGSGGAPAKQSKHLRGKNKNRRPAVAIVQVRLCPRCRATVPRSSFSELHQLCVGCVGSRQIHNAELNQSACPGCLRKMPKRRLRVHVEGIGRVCSQCVDKRQRERLYGLTEHPVMPMRTDLATSAVFEKLDGKAIA
jgi:hypothetical protein